MVLLFDEADCLVGGDADSLSAAIAQLLRQPGVRPFCALARACRNAHIRDYRNEYRDPSQTLGTASPFNIVAKTMTIGNFSRDDIICLYAQHTADTGQVFLADAIDLMWEQTQGQPWLVNAAARVIIEDISSGSKAPVTAEMVSEAIQILDPAVGHAF